MLEALKEELYTHHLAAQGVRQLLVLPADLPTLTASDVRRLIEGHHGGLSLCPAARDGGTNALLLSPPTAIPFLYGPDSARRHLEAAQARGIAARHTDLAGFARDIDTPDDVYWLLEQRIACATLAWLSYSGIRDRLSQQGGLDKLAPPFRQFGLHLQGFHHEGVRSLARLLGGDGNAGFQVVREFQGGGGGHETSRLQSVLPK